MRLSVVEIEAMDRAALIAAWDHLFDTPVPKGLSQSFLRRFLAFEVQARQRGGLPRGFVTGLKSKVGRDADSSAPGLEPGSCLYRDWNGKTLKVEVTALGFRWNNATYPSLSAVARAITGAHWSGPRFFGLKAGG